MRRGSGSRRSGIEGIPRRAAGRRPRSAADVLAVVLSVAVLANRSDVDVEDLVWRALRTASEDGPWGAWYSAEALRAVRCDPRADGGADLDDMTELRD